jgi:hypothetical protein
MHLFERQTRTIPSDKQFYILKNDLENLINEYKKNSTRRDEGWKEDMQTKMIRDIRDIKSIRGLTPDDRSKLQTLTAKHQSLFSQGGRKSKNKRKRRRLTKKR